MDKAPDLIAQIREARLRLIGEQLREIMRSLARIRRRLAGQGRRHGR